MNVTLYFANPKDGTDTYDQIEIARSDDSYASVLATVDIDITSRSQYGTGFTNYADADGDSSYSYKARFKNSSTGAYSGYCDPIAVGESYVSQAVRDQLRDTDSTDYIFSVDELAGMERRAVENLFPNLLRDAQDTSLSIVEDQIDYEAPVGCFRINQVFRGAIADDDWEEIDDFEFLMGRYLRLPEGEVTDSGDVLTIYYKTPYKNAGECPPALANVLVYEVLAECYEILSNDRGVKFKAFAAQQRDSDVRPETLQALADKFRSLALSKRKDIERG